MTIDLTSVDQCLGGIVLTISSATLVEELRYLERGGDERWAYGSQMGAGMLFGRLCFYCFAFWSALLVGFLHSCVPLFFMEHILLNE